MGTGNWRIKKNSWAGPQQQWTTPGGATVITVDRESSLTLLSAWMGCIKCYIIYPSTKSLGNLSTISLGRAYKSFQHLSRLFQNTCIIMRCKWENFIQYSEIGTIETWTYHIIKLWSGTEDGQSSLRTQCGIYTACHVLQKTIPFCVLTGSHSLEL